MAVFVQEQGIDPVLEADGRDADCRHVLCVTEHGTAIATGRLLPEGRIGRLAVLPPWRGRGIGSAVLRRLVEMARDDGLPRISVHAQSARRDFYTRSGFEASGASFTEAGIAHIEMIYTGSLR